MCESTAYLLKGEDEELFLKDVVKVTPQENGKLLVESLLGDQKELTGHIREIDFMLHKITLVEA